MDLHKQAVEPRALLELIKPITWFPPMWAYLCGIVSVGGLGWSSLWLVLLGLFLAGPLVCGMSQAINDWCDRHVDAINEPGRPIPSGRVPAHWALIVAIVMSVAAIGLATILGPWGLIATIVAVVAAWVYSIEPFRLKRSGWWGPGLVGLCYEGLPWFTGAAVMAQALPDTQILLVAALYALGAHGIMTLNDFKAIAGDVATGIKSLPARYGVKRAAQIAAFMMLLPQFCVIALLGVWGAPVQGVVIVGCLIVGQMLAMRRLFRDPERYAPWYNATGVLMYISGMMVAAVCLAQIGADPMGVG